MANTFGSAWKMQNTLFGIHILICALNFVCTFHSTTSPFLLWLTIHKELGNHGCLHMAPMFDPIRQLRHPCRNSFFFPLFAIHELLVTVPYFLSYILVVFAVFQLMAKHAIDYSVFGGPQNFGKWMDVHSAPSCPAEVIKDVYFVF